MYKLFNYNGNTVSIIRVLDNISIPLVEDNTDYQAFLAWLAEGNTPLPADA
jgi:hypothetical protein